MITIRKFLIIFNVNSEITCNRKMYMGTPLNEA